MQRIAIVGCSGGGKSTLARELGAALNLPIIHLDTLFWKPGWVEGDPDEFREAVEAVVEADRWICEGNFINASTLRFQRADTIIWMELPRLVCLWRAFLRAATAFGRTRSDLAPDCPEKIDPEFYRYIWDWDRLTRPRMQRAIETLAPHARLIRLTNDRAKVKFLRQFKQASR
jgi:adenylate kinase family enzyme